MGLEAVLLNEIRRVRRRVASLGNAGATVISNVNSLVSFANASVSLMGAMTAGTLKTALSVTNGRGRLNWAAAYSIDSTSRTIRTKITADGVVVYDKTTSTNVTTVGSGMIAVGGGGGGTSVVFQPIDYDTSILVEIADSLTETDKIASALNHEVHQ